MNDKEMVMVRVNVSMSALALQQIVAHAKKMAGRDAKGHYRVDTADKVGEMITRFLERQDFDQFVSNANNYSG